MTVAFSEAVGDCSLLMNVELFSGKLLFSYLAKEVLFVLVVSVWLLLPFPIGMKLFDLFHMSAFPLTYSPGFLGISFAGSFLLSNSFNHRLFIHSTRKFTAST